MFSWMVYLSVRLALEKLLVVSLLQSITSSNREKGRKQQRKEKEGLQDGKKKKNRGNMIDLLFQGLSPRTILTAIGKD